MKNPMKKVLILLLLVTVLFTCLADHGGRETIVVCASSEQYRNDALQEQLAEAFPDYNIIVSPIGKGFTIGRNRGLTLLHTDNRHQSREGAYMKACINYLTVYRTPFTESVSDCGVKPETAKIIRQIAEQVVLNR